MGWRRLSSCWFCMPFSSLSFFIILYSKMICSSSRLIVTLTIAASGITFVNFLVLHFFFGSFPLITYNWVDWTLNRWSLKSSKDLKKWKKRRVKKSIKWIYFCQDHLSGLPQRFVLMVNSIVSVVNGRFRFWTSCEKCSPLREVFILHHPSVLHPTVFVIDHICSHHCRGIPTRHLPHSPPFVETRLTAHHFDTLTLCSDHMRNTWCPSMGNSSISWIRRKNQLVSFS